VLVGIAHHVHRKKHAELHQEKTMIKKRYSKSGRLCRVTFVLPDVEAQNASLCGEFNSWDPFAHPMKRRKDGTFSLTISLESGRPYHFRYQLDEKTWENDPDADAYAPNPFGSNNSVVVV
jgi:1,4-alpha-glucan branching enzyme